jgi:hypothetical protein
MLTIFYLYIMTIKKYSTTNIMAAILLLCGCSMMMSSSAGGAFFAAVIPGTAPHFEKTMYLKEQRKFIDMANGTRRPGRPECQEQIDPQLQKNPADES